MIRLIARRILFGIMLATSCGALAVAQPSQGHGPWTSPGGWAIGGAGPGAMIGPYGMMGGYWDTDTYLTALRTRLAITRGQESAWKDYADTISGVAQQMRELHLMMFESMASASWEKRRTIMNQVAESRQRAIDAVHEAATGLMLALDPAQKAKAQSALPGFAYGRGMIRMH